MRVESRIVVEGDLHHFEIIDADDTIIRGDDIICESLHISKGYAREKTAESNASKWLAKFRSASEAVRRTMCGYDSVGSCTRKPIVPPVRRRVGS